MHAATCWSQGVSKDPSQSSSMVQREGESNVVEYIYSLDTLKNTEIEILPDGTWRLLKYYSNGKLMARTSVIAAVVRDTIINLEGPKGQPQYFINSQLTLLQNGESLEWDENGALERTGYYLRGEKNGVWTTYEIHSGIVSSQEIWEVGTLVEKLATPR